MRKHEIVDLCMIARPSKPLAQHFVKSSTANGSVSNTFTLVFEETASNNLHTKFLHRGLAIVQRRCPNESQEDIELCRVEWVRIAHSEPVNGTDTFVMADAASGLATRMIAATTVCDATEKAVVHDKRQTVVKKNTQTLKKHVPVTTRPVSSANLLDTRWCNCSRDLSAEKSIADEAHSVGCCLGAWTERGPLRSPFTCPPKPDWTASRQSQTTPLIDLASLARWV